MTINIALGEAMRTIATPERMHGWTETTQRRITVQKAIVRTTAHWLKAQTGPTTADTIRWHRDIIAAEAKIRSLTRSLGTK